MIFNELKATRHVFATTTTGVITGTAPNLVNEFGTAISYPTDKPPVIFPGYITTSNKYFMYLFNDTTTSRKAILSRLAINIETAGGLITGSFFILLPSNVPIRIFVSESTIKSEAIKNGMAQGDADAFNWTNPARLYIQAAVPAQGTLVDGLVEFEYQQ